jgi:hypothetical protein
MFPRHGCSVAPLNFNARIEDVVRSLKKISIAAALAGVLFVGTSSVPLAQQTDDVNELNKRALELYRVGRYSDAAQIAQRVLAIAKRRLVAIIPMSQPR